MGKQITPGEFEIAEMTFQRQGGRFASFVRSAKNALTALNNFFDNTGHQYYRYNYLGEWHSHPSFSTSPSNTDHKSMIELASQDGIGATFIALMVVRLNPSRELEGTITVYLPDGSKGDGKLEFR
jgi:hypothetical protein